MLNYFFSGLKPRYVLAQFNNGKGNHYRWVEWRKFVAQFVKPKGISKHIFTQMKKNCAMTVLVKRCPTIGENVIYKFFFKDGTTCYFRSENNLVEILKKGQQVFVRDSVVDWKNIFEVRFVPEGGLIEFDSHLYTLVYQNRTPKVVRFLP